MGQCSGGVCSIKVGIEEHGMEIKPCPCCGRDPRTDMQLEMEGSSATVYCIWCGLTMKQHDDFNGYKALEKAIKAWNKRAGE